MKEQTELYSVCVSFFGFKTCMVWGVACYLSAVNLILARK